MKPSIAMLLCAAGAVACAHSGRSQSASNTGYAPSSQRVETAQVRESAPTQPGLPTNTPPLAPPTVPATPPPDQTPLTLTPASGVGSPRAQFVPGDAVPSNAASGSAASSDKAESGQDQESIREIRAALASDRTLASAAPQLTIVAKKGRVWLRGQVNTAAQRAGIERAARQAAGVFSVNNELTVSE